MDWTSPLGVAEEIHHILFNMDVSMISFSFMAINSFLFCFVFFFLPVLWFHSIYLFVAAGHETVQFHNIFWIQAERGSRKSLEFLLVAFVTRLQGVSASQERLKLTYFT